ncbi:MAG TPA: site-specific integrase [Phycisphaerae bacterium]|nr:site-specific integrase [Phycisphaerae bacterium]HRY71437.1 site-specific integrase [Phycisphaerae bacterium]HSA29962.1 site-specific integrase [Phycisphaerae bacterium]
MARFPKPFFRTARLAWFVQVGSRQIRLAEGRDEAFRRYHEFMAAPQEPPPVSKSELVAVVVDAFLDFVQQHRSPETYRWYKDRLELFCNAIPASLTVDQLRPFHLQKWIDSHPDRSNGTKRNYCRSIQRAMRWAEEQGYIERSPLAHFKKPRGGSREQVVSVAEYQKLVDNTADESFRDLLTVTWETGCRPQESLRVEARHVDLAGNRWVFPASEAKGGRVPRVIYLTPAAFEITKRLMKRYPQGPLFRNTDGRPWTPDAANCRFGRLKKKLGVKCCLYSLRHSFATRALMRGLDSVTVAVLMGHSDTSMLARHYAHLTQAPSFLLEQARRASE